MNKKVYVKPIIVYESFELSQSIAECEAIANNFDQGPCGYMLPDGWVVFSMTPESMCTISRGKVKDVCFEVFTAEAHHTFGS